MEEIMTNLEDLGAFAAAYISILRYGVPLVGLILRRFLFVFLLLILLLASALVLVLLSPLLAVIAVCIKLDDGGPALFRQKRMTVAGNEFTICKFRTMRAEKGEKPLPVVYAGGVMSNKFIRPILTKGAGWKTYFSEPAFSADNAAGTAILCAMAFR